MITKKMTWDGDMSDAQLKAMHAIMVEEAEQEHPGCKPAGITFIPTIHDDPNKARQYDVTAFFTEASS